MDRAIVEAFALKHARKAAGNHPVTDVLPWILDAIEDAVRASSVGCRENELLLEALEAAGVEHWDNYSHALEIFYELLREEEAGDEDEAASS